MNELERKTITIIEPEALPRLLDMEKRGLIRIDFVDGSASSVELRDHYRSRSTESNESPSMG